MKLFITGGTGFFGKAILRELLAEYQVNPNRFDVAVLSRRPDKFLQENPIFINQPWLKFFTGDICDKNSFPSEQQFTHVLHAATDSTLGALLLPSERFFQIVDGTKNVLQFALDCGAQRFLLTSSGGVYGPQPPDLIAIPENRCTIPDPLYANNAYSIAKRAAEHLCVIFSEEHKLQVVIARCFAFIGEDLPLDFHFAVGNFLRDALSGANIIIQGDGSPVRTYLDQRDLSRWLLTLLFSGRAGQAYNVGSDEEITIKELAYLVRDMVDPGLEVQICQSNISDTLRNRYVPDISKIKSELGVKVSYSLRESLMKVINANK